MSPFPASASRPPALYLVRAGAAAIVLAHASLSGREPRRPAMKRFRGSRGQ